MTYADLVAPAKSDPSKKVFELVEQRIHQDDKPMPPTPNKRLEDNDSSTLDTWIRAGAPASDTACPAPPPGSTPPGTPPGTQPMSCTPDVTMAPTAKWSMPETTDDVYVCYGFDITPAQKRHLIGIMPKVDNPKIVHHLVLFETTSSYATVPAPCSEASSIDWRVVYGWAPGGGNFELPKEAGFPIEATTHYVVQIHYNNVSHLAGQTDQSGFDFCTTDKLRPNDADTVVFGTMSFTVPARGALDETCNVTIPKGTPPVHAFAAFPHMHQIGTSIATTLSPGGTGAPVDLGAKPHWDFQAQTYVPIDATLSGGDVVSTRCVWNNPTDKAISFGPYTEDEMCFSFTMFYPRVQSSASWMAPAEQSRCTKN
jgi:hypothetical protein